MANCPAMLTPGDYEMTQKDNQNDSKEFFLVKLTDSAHRAIEEFQHYTNTNSFTNGERAHMQMNGNSGVIHIPTLANKEGYNFGFSVDAVEGDLECVQQTAEGLDVRGTIPYRMRIHANDDLYVETRTKMAMAGETERIKCTKVIKPNKDEIGRKVKKPAATLANQHMKHNAILDRMRAKMPGGDVQSIKTHIARSQNRSTIAETHHNRHVNASPSPSPILSTSTLSGSGPNNRSKSTSSHGRGSSSNSLPIIMPASKPSSTLTKGTTISNSRASSGQYKSPATSTMVKENTNEVKPSVSSHSTAVKAKPKRGRPPGSSKGGKASSAKGNYKSDVTRCKIRDRVIQMLAVRPYKKLELYSRLHNEGLRDNERSLIATLLRDIALLRDNAFTLRRHIWNDVKEDWPFYSEQERQQLKRNKPQNLTPPISSDAASLTSGQSPPLLNSPSPPQVTTDSNSNAGNKRHSEESYDPIPSKKQRISHLSAKERVGNYLNLPKVNNLVHHKNAHGVQNGKVGSDVQTNADCATMQTKARTTNTQSTQCKRKSEAQISHQQPAESVIEEKSGSSKKSYKSKSSNDTQTFGTDPKKKDKPKGCEEQSTYVKNDKQEECEKQSSEPKEDKHKKTDKQNTDPKKDKHKKSEKQSSVVKKDTPQEAEKWREDTPSTSKEAMRKSKSKKDKEEFKNYKHNTDVPACAKKRASKAEKTEPTSINHGLETSKHIEKPISQYGESKLQHEQHVAPPVPVAQHSATCHSLEDTQHMGQQGPQNAQSQQHPQPQITSPEIAEHAANTDENNAEPQGFNFSSYTPITCVAQRRLYRAEFEQDFVEYNQHLERFGRVRQHFHMLTSQLQQAPPDSPIYQEIHQQIVEEYARTHCAEELQRNRRFNYLHAKLAHITQMVNDYDRILTSTAETAAIEAAVLKHRQREQQQQNMPIAPIPEPEVANLHFMNANTHMQAARAQPNNMHISPMETDNEDKVEVAQPPQVSVHNIQKRRMKEVVKNQETHKKPSTVTQHAPQLFPHGREQLNGQPKNQAQHKNVVENSSKTSSSSSDDQIATQQAQQESVQTNGHPNDQEDDSSSSESDDSSDSSSDDSSSDSSSESDSETSSDDSD